MNDEPQPTAITERQELDMTAKALSGLQRRVFDALYPPDQTGNLVVHAERELRLAGLFDEDADYGGAHAHAVLELVRVFASQGHSGASAALTLDLFQRVASYRTLSPNNHEEYVDVSEMCGLPAGTFLQDARDSRWFSRDGGKTWQTVDERGGGADSPS